MFLVPTSCPRMAHCHPTDLSSGTHNLYDSAKKPYTTKHFQVHKMATRLISVTAAALLFEFEWNTLLVSHASSREHHSFVLIFLLISNIVIEMLASKSSKHSLSHCHLSHMKWPNIRRTVCWSACLDKEVTVRHVSLLLILTRYKNCVLTPLTRTYSHKTQDGILELHFSHVLTAHDTSGKR